MESTCPYVWIFQEIWKFLTGVKPDTRDTITAVATIIIAVIALGVSIWTINVNRKHHELSLTPYLRIRLDRFPNEERISYVIENAGLGPAIIDSVDFFVDSVKINYDHILISAALDLPQQIGGLSIIKGDAVSANHELVWFDLYPPYGIKDDVIHCTRATGRISATIHYKSLYKIPQPPCEYTPKDKKMLDLILLALSEDRLPFKRSVKDKQ